MQKLPSLSVTVLAIFLALFQPLPARAEIPKQWQDLLVQLVDTNSGTNNKEGLDKIRSILIPRFESLGFKTRTYEVANGRKLLAFEVAGSHPDILLLGHIDTVFEPTHSFQKHSRISEGIRGPGVIDMKGGLVLMLHLMTEMKNELHRFRIILMDEEEVGSPNTESILVRLAEKMKYGLVFEPGLPDGALVTSNSGTQWLKLSVRGIPSHAGLEPQKGLNACDELCEKAVKIKQFQLPSKDVTLNIGLIEGGTKPNIVCDQASMTLDIRYQRKSELEWVLKKLEKVRQEMKVYNPILNRYPESTLELFGHSPSLPPEMTRDLFQHVEAIGKTLGIGIKGRHVGYATDGNYLANTQLKLLVGLGPYGGGMHTSEEFMLYASYGERFKLVQELLKKLMKSTEGGAGQHERTIRTQEL